ncbi:MAG TPA: carbohydrate kinase family protein, partial [Thermomicrobiales bacterium]|nr:carbohydrate kinase family protein [Thermomicrobiales bacterium]
ELAGTAGYLALAARGLGLSPFVVSTAGDDEYAAFMRREMCAAGIEDAGLETITGVPSCLALIFVGARGQRGILTVLGAHEQMSAEVAERHDERIAECGEVFLCGNYLLPRFTPRHAEPYARRLRERGQFVVFDPSWDPGGWQGETRSDTFALLRHVDLFLPNEEELLGLTGATSLDEGVHRIREHAPATWVVVKRGPQGAVSIDGDELVEVPGLPIDAVNTIGAGDVFDIALLYGRRKHWDTRRCLEFACATAAYVVAQSGPRTYPNEATVLAFAGGVSAG